MEVTSSNERRPMTFIALTLVLACPFWVLGTSLLVAVLFHTMINTSASLSPYTGSPAAPYIWTVFTALAAVVVARLGWPKAQYRLSEQTHSPR